MCTNHTSTHGQNGHGLFTSRPRLTQNHPEALGCPRPSAPAVPVDVDLVGAPPCSIASQSEAPHAAPPSLPPHPCPRKPRGARPLCPLARDQPCAFPPWPYSVCYAPPREPRVQEGVNLSRVFPGCRRPHHSTPKVRGAQRWRPRFGSLSSLSEVHRSQETGKKGKDVTGKRTSKTPSFSLIL